VPEKEMDDFTDLVKDRMENVLKLDVPIRVDMKKGRNWLEMEAIG
jgi:DNA polymerase-1